MYGIFTDGLPMSLYDGLDHDFRPRWLSTDNAHPFIRRNRKVELYPSLWDCCLRRQPRSLCIYRTYALGDILMLLPILRRMRCELGMDEPIRVVVEKRFLQQLARLNRCQRELLFVEKRGIRDYGCDVHFNLNSVLEADHKGGEASNYHRLALYGQAIGIDVERSSR